MISGWILLKFFESYIHNGLEAFGIRGRMGSTREQAVSLSGNRTCSLLLIPLQLAHDISDMDRARLDNAGIDASQMKLLSLGRVDELHRVHAKAV
jgi:hypothetical protein